MKVRLPFLPTFFVCLAIVFSILVVLRIRSHEIEERVSAATPESAADTRQAGVEQTHTGKPAQSSMTSPAVSTRAGRTMDDLSTDSNAPVEGSGRDPKRIVDTVWFEPRTLRTGTVEALHVRVAPGAPVAEIRGVLLNLNGTARMPFHCSAGSASVWNCGVTVGSCVSCGRWRIETLDVTTSGGETTSFPASLPWLSSPAVSLFADRCDSTPPVLNAVSVDSSDPESGTVTILLTVADPDCGVSAVTGTVRSTAGQSVPVSASVAGDENTWVARFPVTRMTAHARWHVGSLVLTDEAGNVRSYTEADAVLKDVEFELR